jgi:N-acetylglucosaminyldiphosphoundecaprenol N-acetyl-beta-D-mannosaminyltransferase
LKKKILELNISTFSFVDIVNRIIELAVSNSSSYVCVANVHMTIEAHNDRGYAEIVNKADLATPDGMPLVLAHRALYGIKQERVAGMDLLPCLLHKAETLGLGVYFYGGTQETQKRTVTFVEVNYPKIENKHFESPPFRDLTEREEMECINRINQSRSNLVFVALGCPKQEKWMANMKGKINACMVGIGGALPVLVGIQKRAPVWMQRCSLEWLFRLAQEPRRLFKRYLYTNSLFVALFLKQIFVKKLFRSTEYR